MKRMMVGAAVMGVAAMAAPAAAVNLVVNPGLEVNTLGVTPALGWSGTMYFSSSPGYGRNSDGYVSTTCVGDACTSTYNQGAYAAQTVLTTAGTAYDLSFWVAQIAGGPSAFTVFWNGRLVSTVENPNPQGFTTGPIVHNDFRQFFVRGLVANGPTSEFQVHGRSDPGSIIFGDFALEQAVASVPEPKVWGMMIAGFAAIGAALRRRRSAVRALA